MKKLTLLLFFLHFSLIAAFTQKFETGKTEHYLKLVIRKIEKTNAINTRKIDKLKERYLNKFLEQDSATLQSIKASGKHQLQKLGIEPLKLAIEIPDNISRHYYLTEQQERIYQAIQFTVPQGIENGIKNNINAIDAFEKLANNTKEIGIMEEILKKVGERQMMWKALMDGKHQKLGRVKNANKRLNAKLSAIKDKSKMQYIKHA